MKFIIDNSGKPKEPKLCVRLYVDSVGDLALQGVDDNGSFRNILWIREGGMLTLAQDMNRIPGIKTTDDAGKYIKQSSR